MRNIWHKTKSIDEAAEQQICFWQELSKSISSGQFWAEEIKKYKNEPLKRLKIALDNLPLPGAFREAMIAIRAIIKTKRKCKEKFEDELSMLYWLAAIESFSLDYSENLKEPGFNVLSLVPGDKLKSLNFEYRSLGYKYLRLLKKTDIKWLVESWKEPEEHSTLNEVHKELWNFYELQLKKRREERDKENFAELEKIFKSGIERRSNTLISLIDEKSVQEVRITDKTKYLFVTIFLILFWLFLF